MRKFLVLLLTSSVFALYAQSSVNLSQKDIDLYTRTFKSVVTEMTAVAMEVQNIVDPTPEKLMAAQSKITKIPSKYGWGDDYQDKTDAIAQLYGLVKIKRELDQYASTSMKAELQAVYDSEKKRLTQKYGQDAYDLVVRNYTSIDDVMETLTEF